MKNLKYILLTFFTLLGAVSCKNDLLDTKPFEGKYDEATVWGTMESAEAFLFSTYAEVMGNYTGFVGEEGYTANNIDDRGNVVSRGQITRDDDSFGFNRFGQIRRCNLIIEKATASTALSDANKSLLVAEAKFLRAMVNFFLVKRFGRFIWIDKVLTADDELELPLTADASASYQLVMKDIDDAIAGLPETSASGRANKFVALALKSEVALQAAAYTGDAGYFQKAIDAADAVIGSGKYAIDPDYEGMFNEKNRFSKETIMGVYRSSANTNCDNIEDLQNVVPNTNNDNVTRSGGAPLFKVDKVFEAWLYHAPSQNLVDKYLVIDQSTGNAVKWNESSQFKKNLTRTAGGPHTETASYTGATGNVSSLIYANRDKRFYATVVYDSCTWFNETVTTKLKGNLHRLVNGALGPHIGVTNYYWRKGVYNVAPRVFYGIPTDYHWPIFRLSEVYLNKAEALLKQGKVAEAVTAFNVTRVGHGQLPASRAASLADAWEDYKLERQVELVKEKDYYWSLLRWGKYGREANHGIAPGGNIPELEEVPTFIEISQDRKGYFIDPITFNVNNVRDFDETKRYLFPIPQGQINRNSKLQQNPNW